MAAAPHDADSDDSLMSRIAKADRFAFHLLMQRHTKRCLALALRMLGNASEAEDVVQEAFMRVWTHAGRWQPGRAKVGTWLYKIVMNLCVDRRRKPVHAAIEEAPEPIDPDLDAFGGIAREQHVRQVQAALHELPDRQRAALILCYFEELSSRDAAEVLGVSIAALESLLVRGRRALRDRLAALEPEVRGA